MGPLTCSCSQALANLNESARTQISSDAQVGVGGERYLLP